MAIFFALDMKINLNWSFVLKYLFKNSPLLTFREKKVRRAIKIAYDMLNLESKMSC